MAPRRRCRPGRAASRLALLWTTTLLRLASGKNISTLPIPQRGNASLTHYELPLGALASCGCSTGSTYFPTAALSQAAYGSSLASGPACGQCFNLTLLETFGATPEWVPTDQQRRNASVVVKIADKCPAPPLYDPDKTWCGATASKPNKAGFFLHFDLSSPSPSIPLSFFPVNASYGYDDFGSWIVEFEQVSCERWAGWGNQSALGLDASLTNQSGCCPANPLSDNSVCPAFSLKAAASPFRLAPTAAALLLLASALSLAFIA
ncbi:RlpA-like double-psi beta-barrel-containing protein domain-containing protein [Rhodotorula toruloides]|uniref:RlpA-like double-psi beta-barrel-containing protein domain-containing protein n=1 Tax=Rhodotorula toruloides TaxID=5286 RepID=A0A2T0AFA4_RHOTO|nr:RlpA-like double-psi beta-barrel-containing protein domain-containing protein [Rhodotorula toruloides]PRQ76689.1 RlpA-like double-psi beta-barrel-containing protein domain-containing protein [Rhodotorula toruloides]